MKKTGVKVTQEDFDKLVELVKKDQHLKQGISIVSEKKGKVMYKDEASDAARIEVHKMALFYGLPEITGYYGINRDREFVTI